MPHLADRFADGVGALLVLRRDPSVAANTERRHHSLTFHKRFSTRAGL
jgi:hypothetical protein